MGRQPRTHGAQVYCTSSPGDRQHRKAPTSSACTDETTTSAATATSPTSFAASKVFWPRTLVQAPAQTSASRTGGLAAQVVERLVDAFDGDDFHAFDALLGLVGRRDDRAMESELCGFSQPLLTAQQGESLRVQANRHPPRKRALYRVDQRLHFNQQGSRALQRRQHATPRHRVTVLRQKQRRRIGDALQSAFGHREYA